MIIKICGITSTDDARFCASLHVELIGLVFVPGSPRFVSSQVARRISDEIHERSPRTKVVGVFQDAPLATIRRTADEVGLDAIQLHGTEDPEIAGRLSLPVIRALTPGTLEQDWSAAEWFLFDHAAGGTGRTLDWSLIPRVSKPFFLAGGLTPRNVLEATRAVRPDGVDVSSGVERSPGVKDHSLIARFVEKVRSS